MRVAPYWPLLMILALHLKVWAGVSRLEADSCVPKLLAPVEAKEVHGSIPGFRPFFSPKFSRQELEANRHRLRPGSSEFVLGETGFHRWVVEERMIKGQPQIVAVKYNKFSDPVEVVDLAVRSMQMRSVFMRLGLLKHFDVLPVLYTGEDHVVYPYLEGEALSHLTLRALEHRKPPRRFLNPNVDTLGPPTAEEAPELRVVWDAFSLGIKEARSKLKQDGFEISQVSHRTSFSGVSYLFAFFADKQEAGGSVSLSLRPDVIVTTDGRLVFVDPY